MLRKLMLAIALTTLFVPILGCASTIRVTKDTPAVIQNVDGTRILVAGEYGNITAPPQPVAEVRMYMRVFSESSRPFTMGWPEGKGFEVCVDARDKKYAEDYPRTKQDAAARCIWQRVEEVEHLIPPHRTSQWVKAPPSSRPYRMEYMWTDGMNVYVCPFWMHVDLIPDDVQYGGMILDNRITFKQNSFDRGRCSTVPDDGSGEPTTLRRVFHRNAR